MTTSRKKIESNRRNGKKSHGPIDTSSTRFNSTKHALNSVGLTELDDAQAYQTIVRDLIQEKNPVGTLETMLLEAAAFDLVRWPRARRLEAEHITSLLYPPQYEKNVVRDLDLELQGKLLDPGVPAAIGAGTVQYLVNTYQRYESCFANRLYRTLHEFERLQRMRQGERLPAPAAVDVTVHADARTSDSNPVAAAHSNASPSDGDSTPALSTEDVKGDAESGKLESADPSEHFSELAVVDVTVHADDRTSDSNPIAAAHSNASPSDGESMPVLSTEDEKGGVDSGMLEPADPSEHFSELAADNVVGVETPVLERPLADSTRVAWKPRPPSGPIWSKR